MALRMPCTDCGEPTHGTRCPDCLGALPTLNSHRWRQLRDRQIRRQPACIDCGSTTHPQGDHIIPLSHPEGRRLAYEPCNITTRCRTCNRLKGQQEASSQEIDAVYQCIARRRSRRTTA